MYNVKRNVRCKNCNSKRCEVCININETSTLTSTPTGEIFTINYMFYYNARCLLTCRKYKIQHVGQKVDQIHSRWNNYKNYSKKFSRRGSCMQQHLFNHFSTSGHAGLLDDVSITFIGTFTGTFIGTFYGKTIRDIGLKPWHLLG